MYVAPVYLYETLLLFVVDSQKYLKTSPRLALTRLFTIRKSITRSSNKKEAHVEGRTIYENIEASIYCLGQPDITTVFDGRRSEFDGLKQS